MRLSKFIAQAGICSRRAAEKLIEEGRVKVNNKIIAIQGVVVTNDDVVSVDGKTISPQSQIKIWLYHKPKGVVTTHNDPEGRPTVFDSLPEDMGHIISVGRLDINSEGLLILTNSGEFARKMELPSSNIPRIYHVRVFGKFNPEIMQKSLAEGVIIDGIIYSGIKMSIMGELAHNTWLELELREGKNREIRNIMHYFNLKISRLIRMEFGDYKLGSLKPGALRRVL